MPKGTTDSIPAQRVLFGTITDGKAPGPPFFTVDRSEQYLSAERNL